MGCLFLGIPAEVVGGFGHRSSSDVAMQPVKQKKTAVSLAETAVLCVRMRGNYSSSSLARLRQKFWMSSYRESWFCGKNLKNDISSSFP